MLCGIDQHDIIFLICNTYLEFIVLKYSQIYYKYFQFNEYTELRYHGITNFVTVLKNDIAVLLNFRAPPTRVHLVIYTCSLSALCRRQNFGSSSN